MTKRQNKSEWQALKKHQQEISSFHLRDLFSQDHNRFDRYSLAAANLFLDYSKNLIDEKTLSLLFQLAESCELSKKINELFSGGIVNPSEQRPALHAILRYPPNRSFTFNNEKISDQIFSVRERMKNLSERFKGNRFVGITEKKITDIIHVGIGGSDLGPKMIYEALRERNSLQCHFISNHDHVTIERVLSDLNPETTVAIFVSKTFTTQETLANAEVIRNWLVEYAKTDSQKQKIQHQLFAVTTATDRATAFGILSDHIFPFWEWVGGRYSVWSAVSLSIVLSLGMENFEKFLSGGYAMDQHFEHAPFSQNMPVILALLGIWYQNFFNASTKAIIPYSDQLKFFPDFLQQLIMESEGKQVNLSGEKLDYSKGGIIWGGVGTNSQHSFHQLLFQGTQFVPIDFILPLTMNHELISNCLAQSRTFMEGYSEEEIIKDLMRQGMEKDQIYRILPHKRMMGNCPSNTLLLKTVDPFSLGSLIALYEHMVFVQSVIWNINPFDQWGVERGKVMAKAVTQALSNDKVEHAFDASTNGLLKIIKEQQYFYAHSKTEKTTK